MSIEHNCLRKNGRAAWKDQEGRGTVGFSIFLTFCFCCSCYLVVLSFFATIKLCIEPYCLLHGSSLSLFYHSVFTGLIFVFLFFVIRGSSSLWCFLEAERSKRLPFSSFFYEYFFGFLCKMLSWGFVLFPSFVLFAQTWITVEKVGLMIIFSCLAASNGMGRGSDSSDDFYFPKRRSFNRQPHVVTIVRSETGQFFWYSACNLWIRLKCSTNWHCH